MDMSEINDKIGGIPDRQVRALVQLLAEEDAAIAEAVRAKILALGSRAVPYLREALAQQDVAIRGEAHDMLACLAQAAAAQRFQVFSKGAVDLEVGAFLIAQVAYPDLNVAAYRQRLDLMAGSLKERLGARSAPDTVIQTMNHYLFVELGFQGDNDDYANPENSYLNRVLDRKLGIPISLSAVYLFLSRRLDLPVMGVGLPGHFLVTYTTGREARLIDPFNAGRVLTRDQCIDLVTRMGHPWREDYLGITPDRAILVRMIRNLITSYTNRGDKDRAADFSEYLKMLTL